MDKHPPAWLVRHGLVKATGQAWSRWLSMCSDPTDVLVLSHWKAFDLPLMVVRQCDDGQPLNLDAVALGLPAPTQWARKRIPLRIEAQALSIHPAHPQLPTLQAVAGTLCGEYAVPAQAFMRQLDAQLHTVGVLARVYGSYGWQTITALPYVHTRSDLDLCLSVQEAVHADAVCDVLHRLEPTQLNQRMRVDGELIFPDGTAIAWREWSHMRQGHMSEVLIKRIEGCRLVAANRWDHVAA